MDELIKVVILGIVEGITEFLPISSTGHLLVVSAFLNSEIAERLGGTFEIFIQLGAVLAVVGYYRHDLIQQVTTVHKDRKVQHLWLAVIVASIPAAILGFFLRDFIKDTLFPQDIAPYVVGITLILGGFVFLIVERNLNVKYANTLELEAISLRQAFIIGFAQAIALVPGVSRSGAAIIGAMLVGVNRPVATAFSFYLAIPILGGATILDLFLSIDEIQSDDLIYLLIGTIVSGIVAWFAIDWLLKYVSHHTFILFGQYRIIAGVMIFTLLLADIV